MDLIFQTSAAIGATLIVCQFLMSLFGLGGDSGDGDASYSHEGGGGHGGDHSSTWAFGELTLRTFAASLAFFGLTGMAARRTEMPNVAVIVLAVAAGLGAFFLVSWLLRFVNTLNADGTVNIRQACDRMAKVYVAIPGDMIGAGKVHVEISGRTLEYKAQTLGARLATGTPVRIVGILGHDTVEVVPMIELASSPPPPPPSDLGGFTGSKES